MMWRASVQVLAGVRAPSRLRKASKDGAEPSLEKRDFPNLTHNPDFRPVSRCSLDLRKDEEAADPDARFNRR